MKAMPDATSTDPADQVLNAVASEIESLQSLASGLETLLGTVLHQSETKAHSSENRQLMQDFDLLTQSLEGLKDYLSLLALAAVGGPDIKRGDALAALKLGAMRDRLSGSGTEPLRQPQTRSDGGNVDLF